MKFKYTTIGFSFTKQLLNWLYTKFDDGWLRARSFYTVESLLSVTLYDVMSLGVTSRHLACRQFYAPLFIKVKFFNFRL